METGPASQDIILYDNASQRKSHGILYLLLGFLGVIIIFLIISIIVSGRAKPTEIAKGYYNYLITGNTNSGDFSNDDEEYSFMREMVSSDDAKQYTDFYNTTRDNLKELISVSQNPRFDDIYKKQLEYLDMFEFNSWLLSNDTNALIGLYLNSNDSINMVTNWIEIFIDSSDESIKEYGAIVQDVMWQVAGLVGFYDNIGCKGKSFEDLAKCNVRDAAQYGVANYLSALENDFIGISDIINDAVSVYLDEAKLIAMSGDV